MFGVVAGGQAPRGLEDRLLELKAPAPAELAQPSGVRSASRAQWVERVMQPEGRSSFVFSQHVFPVGFMK